MKDIKVDNMKNLCAALILCLVIFLPNTVLGAAEKKAVAVMPFNVHSAEPLDYVKQGIWDMLSSRLSADDQMTVISREQVMEALKEFAGKEVTVADVYGLGKKMNADYVIWGSITKIGKSLSIDGKLIDVAAQKSPVGIFVQSQNMDDVIPRISDFAQRINQHITGVQPVVATAPDLPATTVSPAPQGNSREATIIAGMRSSKKGTFTAAINADFINAAQPLDRKGFWMSEKYPTEFVGMDIGDVNGDGLNEVVVIDVHNIYIYQKTKNDFKLLQKIAGKSADKYLSVDVADINRNGVNEIIVTSISQTMLNSFIVEFRQGKFVIIASDLRWFLRVISTPAAPVRLLGQKLSIPDQQTLTDTPFNTPIYEIVWDNGQYVEGKRMRIPQGLSVYGLTLDEIGPGTEEKIIAMNEDNYLCIYEQTTKPLTKLNVFGGSKERLFKSDDVFGGSNNSIDLTSVQTQSESQEGQNRYYINLRILTYDTNKDKKRELVIVKNLSASAGILKNIKLFTSSEVYNLEWDGLGLIENWKTRKISGYVADYQFKDIDNDGENEIVLALVQSVGATIGQRSVFVAYKMNVQPPPQ